MREELLHFIWQYQLYDRKDLRTTDGEPLAIIRPGVLNTDAGPDFGQARVRIGALEWAGQVEIHVRATDWAAHRHQHDPAYGGVVLHVVHTADGPAARPDGTPLPTLELGPRLDPALADRYGQIRESLGRIPCEPHFAQVPDVHKTAMTTRALLRRLERKATDVLVVWEQTRHDWEETTYRLLAQNLGFKTNAAPMRRLAEQLPLRLLQKHADQLPLVEALLFGQAGLLAGTFEDDYPQRLQRDYRLLRQKYSLPDTTADAPAWKFARMRPANFPTRRLAQWAALLAAHPNLFSLFTTTESIDDLRTALRVSPSAFWEHHYHFRKRTTEVLPPLGESSADNLIVNTVAPLLAAYARARQQEAWLARALEWLEALPAENNRVTRLWRSLGAPARTAADAQGQLEWYAAFCNPKQCLRCNVGAQILRRAIP